MAEGSADPRYKPDGDDRHPNQSEDADFQGPDQLCVRACLTWPLRGLALRERLALERVIEVDLVLQDHVDRAGDLLLDEGASDGRVLLPGFLLIEPLDLRVVLNSTDGRMAQRELQIPVPILTASVPVLPAGGTGSDSCGALSSLRGSVGKTLR